jgi:hypothetical protein
MTEFGRLLRIFVFLLVPFIACGDWFAAEDPCDDVNCNDGNSCTRDTCTHDCSTATCHHDPVANGTRCKVSGVSGVCMGGVCDLCSGVVCEDDGNECTSDICDRNTGRCGVPAADGTVCEHKGLFSGLCASGFCAKSGCDDGVCDDGNECTNDTCDSTTRRCNYTPVQDRIFCDLGGSPGMCLSGLCQPEPECEFDDDCEDQNDCTQDFCIDGFCDLVPLAEGMPCQDDTGVCESGICVFN